MLKNFITSQFNRIVKENIIEFASVQNVTPCDVQIFLMLNDDKKVICDFLIKFVHHSYVPMSDLKLGMVSAGMVESKISQTLVKIGSEYNLKTPKVMILLRENYIMYFVYDGVTPKEKVEIERYI
jgi:hypothetical protein